jgi:hypothetical protein
MRPSASVQRVWRLAAPARFTSTDVTSLWVVLKLAAGFGGAAGVRSSAAAYPAARTRTATPQRKSGIGNSWRDGAKPHRRGDE